MLAARSSETLPDTAASANTGSNNGTGSGKTGGLGCGNGGSTPGCPATSGDTPFAGQPVSIISDGLTPIAWSTAGVTLMYGPEGPDHQTTTAGGGSTGSATTAAWLHLDALGSIRAVTDTSGSTIAAASYTD